MVLARHPALPKDSGIPWRMPARFLLSAAGISALSAIVVFMMFLIQEQHSSAKAAALAVRSPTKTAHPVKAPPPVEAPRPPVKTAPTAAVPRTGMEDFDLSRSRQWKTIGTLKLRVTRIDLRHGSCDLSIFQPGHRILNSHLFIGSRLTIPADLGARATQIMITGVGKNRVSGYVLAGTGENRESSQTEVAKHRQRGA